MALLFIIFCLIHCFFCVYFCYCNFIVLLNWIIVVLFSCMQRRSTAGDLIPIDLEINVTCRRHNLERIGNFLQDLEAIANPKEEPRSFEASSSFPIVGHSHIEPVEDPIMAEEPRRVTLEDYSSFTVPQFFTSIAQPKVQAQTITYPPSLI